MAEKLPEILSTDVWFTIGFTYHERKQTYCLIRLHDGKRLCLACVQQLESAINAFCFNCKAPTPPDWTTGDKPLDALIKESWSNVRNTYDSYIQWIEYSLLINVQEMTSLRHGCTHIANWPDGTTKEGTKVTLTFLYGQYTSQSARL